MNAMPSGCFRWRNTICGALCLIISAAAVTGARGDSFFSETDQQRLLSAYPDHLLKIENGEVIWRDTTRMKLDDGHGQKSFDEWLERPDIADMFAKAYVPGDLTAPPAKDDDPGRARNAAFFDKMYGDCTKHKVEPNLATVIWLPKKSGQQVRMSTVNGVAAKLEAVSAELDQLAKEFDKFLVPSDGTYNCRVIAGTDRVSAHGYGIAIDLATKHSNYWRWAKTAPGGAIVYRNEIPPEIVRIFEKHGFIWGGKWHHYDTMHFEYRPELLPPSGTEPPR